MDQQHLKTVCLALIGLAVAGLLAACGGQSSPSGQSAPAANDTVTPLTGPEAQGDMAIKTAGGLTPCGVFNVNGFGQKRVNLSDYPACSATSYRVLCLDGNAKWQPTNVSNVGMSTDKKQVTFTSAQEGACGLFAAQQ